MRKASGIIYIVILTAYIMFIGIILISIAIDNAYISDSVNSMNSAYYIAESGIERSISMITRDLKLNFNVFIIDSKLDADLNLIKQKFDADILGILSSFNSLIKQYEFYNGDSGKYVPNGNDTILFSSLVRKAAYYKITSISLQPLDIILIDDQKLKYSILIDLTSVGHFDKSVKEIRAKYTVGLIYNIESFDLPEETVFNLYKCDVKLSSLQY